MANKKKMKKKFIIILLICLFIMLALVVFLQKKIKEKEYNDSIQEFQKFRAEYEAQTILPRKIYELYNYEGEYDRDYLYKNMKIFTDYLDYLQNDVNINNSKEFYEENSEEVLSVLGIENQENFETFLKNIQNKNLKKDELKYAEIEAGSSYTENGYFKFNLNLYYGENEEMTKFLVSFAESKNSKIKVSYEFKQ